MITIQGQYNTAICYTNELEGAAREQIQAVCDRPEFAGCKIRIMPDVHAGKGCTIGTTMTIQDTIVPGMVGVDIGCGMETVELAEREIDFAKLDALIRERIPYGREIRDIPHPLNSEIDLTQLRCADQVNLDRAVHSIGSLGGGNHFIEVDQAGGRRSIRYLWMSSRKKWWASIRLALYPTLWMNLRWLIRAWTRSSLKSGQLRKSWSVSAPSTISKPRTKPNTKKRMPRIV